MILARGPDLRIRFAVAPESTVDLDPRSTSVGHRTAFQVGQRSKPSKNSLPNAILSRVLGWQDPRRIRSRRLRRPGHYAGQREPTVRRSMGRILHKHRVDILALRSGR